jgi:dephospho-CoA kinase
VSDLLIAVVGVCAAGKSTLAAALRARGYNARQVLQEHSYVPRMWQVITRPDALFYLDASLETVRTRRRDPAFPEALLAEERRRLIHARTHCDLYVMTDGLTSEQVFRAALDWLEPRANPAD